MKYSPNSPTYRSVVAPTERRSLGTIVNFLQLTKRNLKITFTHNLTTININIDSFL